MTKKTNENPDSLIQDDPYIFERCQIDLHMSLFPKEEDRPRRAVLGISSHGDAPTLAFYDDAEVLIDRLGAEVRILLDRFRAELPERHLSRLRRTAESGQKKRSSAQSVEPPQDEAEKTSPEKQLGLFGGEQ